MRRIYTVNITRGGCQLEESLASLVRVRALFQSSLGCVIQVDSTKRRLVGTNHCPFGTRVQGQSPKALLFLEFFVCKLLLLVPSNRLFRPMIPLKPGPFSE